MTTRTATSCAAVLSFVLTSAYAQSDAIEPKRLTPAELAWSAPAPEVGRVFLAGDNETEGLYAYRVRFPGGFRNEPHFHPDDRMVTIISGTLHMGYGEVFDEGALKPLPAGSFWTEPGGQPHFVWAREGEVIIQVIGDGPSGTVQVNSNP